MTQRGRTRNTGAIDTRIADTVDPPLALPWVTGRFYDGSVQIVTALGTSVMSTSTYATPIYVPHPVTVTSIGVESTTGSSAGGLLRFAIYNSEPITCLPNKLIIDSGTVASDATGFLAATISQVLFAGWHWLVASNSASPTTVTVRTQSNGAVCYGAYQYNSIDAPNQQPAQGIRIQLSTNVVNVGYPAYFFRGSIGGQAIALESASQQYPRTMIGV